MQVLEVDPRDDDAFDRWYGVLDAVGRAERPGEAEWFRSEVLALALDGRAGDDGTPPHDEQQRLFLAVDAGAAVGALQVELPLNDNGHLAWFLLRVLPPARRRGVGRTLLATVEEVAKAAGRTTLGTSVDEPPGARSAGSAFAAATGFRPVLAEARRDLALPVDPSRLDALEAAAAPHAAGYRVATLTGRWPDAWVADRAELGRRMSTDVPLGDLDWQEEAWDAARVRRHEDRFRRQGRRLIGAAAVHEATGEVVAYSELVVPPGPERVWQYDTIVAPEHRGHRLGLLVKLAALRRLQQDVPEARLVTTHNADSNAHMIAVNEALGFVPNGVLTDWQRTC